MTVLAQNGCHDVRGRPETLNMNTFVLFLAQLAPGSSPDYAAELRKSGKHSSSNHSAALSLWITADKYRRVS
jgi:pantothenate kinase